MGINETTEYIPIHNEDILTKLLTLNLELAEKEKQSQTVIDPESPN
jgi:hypothetical protein